MYENKQKQIKLSVQTISTAQIYVLVFFFLPTYNNLKCGNNIKRKKTNFVNDQQI